MEVILLDKISKLGELGSKVRVRRGFGRNFLIPQGKALPATKANLARFEAQRAELEKAAEGRLEKAQQRASVLEGLVVTIKANTGEEGRLFGSVGAHEIVHAMTALGHALAKNEVCLPSGPFRQVGEYDVELRLQGSDISARIKVSVASA